jgi:hypothetical protein
MAQGQTEPKRVPAVDVKATGGILHALTGSMYVLVRLGVAKFCSQIRARRVNSSSK